MRRLATVLSAGVVAAAATIAASAAPASAATPPWTYAGYSGAAQIHALGTTITSGLIAESSLVGTDVPAANKSGVADVHVGTLANAKVVDSSQTVTGGLLGGVTIDSAAEVADVNLLDGLITADAIETTATASTGLFGLSGDANTKFVNLKISGQPLLALNLGKNSTISIPGIAEVVLNESKVVEGPGTIHSAGAALHVTLLKAHAGAPAGAEVWVNPAVAMLMPTPDSNALPVGGEAYSTYIGAGVGPNVRVISQPTGKVTVPAGGTNGVPHTQSLASVKLGALAKVFALENSLNATTVPGFSDVATRSSTARVNLLGGLITANAIDVGAHVRVSAADNVSEVGMNFVNLRIAGAEIPIDVAPNTKINIAGIAKVFINEQVTTPTKAGIVGLRVVVTTAGLGLPVGAEIRVAVATASVG